MPVRRLLLVLLPLLPAAEPAARPGASPVSIDASQRPLAEVAAEIGRQANVPIDIDHADGERPVTLRLSNAPFWEALEQLARAADQRLTVGVRPALSREPYRAVPVSVSGPFRFAVRNTLGRLNLDTGAATTEVQMVAAWEPRFKAYFAELDPASLAARDDQGRALNVINEGSTRMALTTSTPELSVKLGAVPRDARRIAQLDGAVTFLGTAQLLQFAFDLDAEPAPIRRAEVTGRLASFRQNVRLWTAVVELEYPPDMPKFESFESFLLDNEAWLLRPDGAKFATKKFELGFQREGKVPVTYYFQENEKDGPALGDRRGWKLVVRVPGRIIEEKVPFRLRDVPLP